MSFYDCDICGFFHPTSFDGDCRDDDNRFTHKEIPDDAKILTMGEVMDGEV